MIAFAYRMSEKAESVNVRTHGKSSVGEKWRKRELRFGHRDGQTSLKAFSFYKMSSRLDQKNRS